jgi:apolipoprotein N-acyltransferase
MPAERGTLLIAYEIEQLAKAHPNLQLIVMPESSWNGLPLNEIFILPAFKNLSIPHIIIGSFTLQNKIHCNSMYWFKRGQRAGRFDKRHAVPFIERIPWGGHLLSKHLFFKQSDPICPSKGSRSSLMIDDGITLLPFICSELFCNNTPYDPLSSHPILAACNDWWFGLAWFRQLMLMVAQLRAVQWNRPILYISFYYAEYIDPNGIKHPIATTA